MRRSVGFIGLGNMGAHMARSLLRASGAEVLVHDLSASRVRELESSGARACEPPEMAARCDAVVTMLPACAQVLGAYTGPGGLLARAKDGALFVDCSTVAPSTSRAVAEAAAAAGRGLAFADAPVSGGVGAAEQGTLTFMVGAEEAVFRRARDDVLRHMGSSIVRCGATGTGAAAKLVNNLALAIQMVGTAEAIGLGSHLGLDPGVLASIMRTSTARCWSADAYNPCPGVMEGVPSARDYEGGFAASLMHKDLSLALKEAAAQPPGSAPLPLGGAAAALYEQLVRSGSGHKDFSVIFRQLYPSVAARRAAQAAGSAGEEAA